MTIRCSFGFSIIRKAPSRSACGRRGLPETAADQAHHERQHDALSDQSRVELKLNTTCVKLAPSVEAVSPSKKTKVTSAPIAPPIAASASDSINVPKKAGNPPKPMARNVAISVARAATEEYMVLRAPARAPNAIAMASGQPSFWMRSDVLDACSAKYAASDLISSSLMRGSSCISPEIGQRRGAGEPRAERLKYVHALEQALHHRKVGPDFQFEHRPSGGEDSNHERQIARRQSLRAGELGVLIDLKTGRPIETDVTTRARAGEQVTVWPSILGGKNWEPMSFNPQNNTAYANTLNFGARYKAVAAEYKAGEWYIGLDLSDLWAWPDGPRGYLKAIDPLTGKANWEAPSDIPRFSGVLSTGGGVVFSGQLTGEFEAFDADTGKKLWQFQTGSGIEGQPVTWEQDGVQYVAVSVGIGGVYTLFSGDPQLASVPAGGSLWVFALAPE